jgi:aminomethyltransferase
MSGAPAARTPLHDVLADLGAEFVEWDGWTWTNSFGDPVAEHHAVRTRAGMWDFSALHKLEFRGPDALAAADRVFTSNMLSLEVGQVRFGPICDEAGMMLSDGCVFKHADDHALVTTTLESDLEHIETVVRGLDLEIERITRELALIQLQGPATRDLLAPLCDRDLRELAYFRFWPEIVHVGGVPCRISRTGYSGELGYELWCRPGDAEALWEVLIATGAVAPYGLAAIETLRIEAGLLFIYRDYLPGKTDPFTLGRGRSVDLDTGDFCGRAMLVKIASEPPGQMVSLVLEGSDVPAYGAPVTKGGERAGTLTSPCLSPTLGCVLGLAILEPRFARLGEVPEVEIDGGTASARVASLPAYDPTKSRPRA